MGGTSDCGSGSRRSRGGLPGRAGAVLPQVREGAGWREGAREAGAGGREERGREEGARAHTCPGQQREPSCASLGLCRLREEKGGLAGGGGTPRGGGGGGSDGWLGSRSFSLPLASPAHTLPLPLTHSPLDSPPPPPSLQDPLAAAAAAAADGKSWQPDVGA